MNIAAFLGLLLAGGITAFAVLTSSDDYHVFLDVHGIVIVLGGTMSVALLAFRGRRLWQSFRIIFRKMFGNQNPDYLGTIRQIVQTAQVYRSNPKGAYDQLPAGTHPFFRDGIKMLVEYGFSYDDLDEVLHSALMGKKNRDNEEVKVWQTISRFPPAFGLLGATVGMIALLQTLGTPGAQERIGPAMATALVATFMGLTTANFFLIPISENLLEISNEDFVLRKIIKEGVLLIQAKRHPVFIEEYLKSFLAPGQRGQLDGIGSAGGGTGGSRAA